MRSPDHQSKREDLLRCLVLATSLLTRARTANDKHAYRSVFELAKSIERYFNHTPMMHYILGVARLNGWGDRDYAREKWQVIANLKPAFSLDLAETLKREIDQGVMAGPGRTSPAKKRAFPAARLPVL